MLSSLDYPEGYLNDILMKSETRNKYSEDAKLYSRELKITVLRSLKKNANCLFTELYTLDKSSIQMVEDLII